MAEYATEAEQYFAARAAAMGGVVSGIVGDQAHTFGYHRARNVLPSGDYSVQLPPDRLGDGNAASAVDVSYGPAMMKLITGRLAAAADAGDPRMNILREFYGTTDGGSVDGRTHSGKNADWEYATSDDSHLWHVHWSFFREFSNNRAAMDGVLSVMSGSAINSPSTEEDDDMAFYSRTGPVGVNTVKPYGIPPKNPVVVSLGADIGTDKATLRVVAFDGNGKIVPMRTYQTNGSWGAPQAELNPTIATGKPVYVSLQLGTRLISVERKPVDKKDSCTKMVDVSFEILPA